MRRSRYLEPESDSRLEPIELLAAAIISLAVSDFKELDGEEYRYICGERISKWELVNFFRSKWCQTLLRGLISVDELMERAGL